VIYTHVASGVEEVVGESTLGVVADAMVVCESQLRVMVTRV